jgi:hypothetical protein
MTHLHLAVRKVYRCVSDTSHAAFRSGLDRFFMRVDGYASMRCWDGRHDDLLTVNKEIKRRADVVGGRTQPQQE